MATNVIACTSWFLFWKFSNGTKVSVLGMFGYLFNSVNMLVLIISAIRNLGQVCNTQERGLIIGYFMLLATKLEVLVAAALGIKFGPEGK